MNLDISRKAILQWGLALSMACTIASPARAQTVTMKVGAATVNDAQHEWMKQYKTRVEKASNGRIKVDIYPASQLGPIPRMIEGLQLGTVEVFLGPTDFFVGVDPRFMVYGMPGVYRDRAHAAATLHDPAIREPLMNLAEPRGIRGISTFILGTPAYLARKPIRTLDDFKGQKLRINASEVERESVQRLGSSATPMPLSEVIPALQTGVIDGTRSVPAVYVNFKYGDLAKTMTVTEDSYLVTFVGISKVWLGKQPADLQKIIVDEARAIEPGIQDWANSYEDKMLAQWKTDGGEVVRLPGKDQAELMKRMQGVGQKVVQDRSQLKPVYEQMLTTAKSK